MERTRFVGRLSVIAAGLVVGLASASAHADEQIDRLIGFLSGTWKATQAIDSTTGEDAAVVYVHMVPVEVEGIDNAMYAEFAREDNLQDPYRQIILEAYRFEGNLRLRTLEFRNEPGIKPTLVGLWLAPDLFPALDREDLIATLDIDLMENDANGFEGKTPYPYPTSMGGAVQMTSALYMASGVQKTLAAVDRGYDANGDIVWGPESDEGITFVQSGPPPGVSLNRFQSGLVVIEFRSPPGEQAEPTDRVAVDYTGWVRDAAGEVADASLFDSSRQEGREPFVLVASPEWQVIEGWKEGVPGMTVGSVRRLIIPSTMAYGERGVPGRIPPGASLFFDVECVNIKKPDDVSGGDQ